MSNKETNKVQDVPAIGNNVVQSAVIAPENTLQVRFKPNSSNNPKAPVFYGLIAMPGALKYLITEIPIFRAKDGVGYDVMMPGGRFPSLRAANTLVTDGEGRKWETVTPEPEGKSKADQLPKLILTAFGAYLTSKEPEQSISFA